MVQGGVPGPGGVPGLGGPGGVPGPGGVYLFRGVPGPRGCTWSGGVYLVLPRGQTHACKNITFATSLRTVIIYQVCQRCKKGSP